MYKEREIGGFRVIGGCLVVPRKWWGSLFAWALIIGPSLVQVSFVNSQYAWAGLLDGFYAVTMCLSLAFLFCTTFSDPGVIPRRNPASEQEELNSIFVATDAEQP